MRNKTSFHSGRIYFLLVLGILGYPLMVGNAQTVSGKIDRKALVTRHNLLIKTVTFMVLHKWVTVSLHSALILPAFKLSLTVPIPCPIGAGTSFLAPTDKDRKTSKGRNGIHKAEWCDTMCKIRNSRI